MKARKTFELGPEQWDDALRMIEATIAQARAAGDLDSATRAMLTRAGMMTEAALCVRKRKGAFLELLGNIERMREIQPEPEVRGSSFHEVAHRLSGLRRLSCGGRDRARLPSGARARSVEDVCWMRLKPQASGRSPGKSDPLEADEGRDPGRHRRHPAPA